MNTRAAFLATTAFIAIASASSATWAQTASAPSIDEVVVTAQKRAENVQDIPKQVQVVTTEVLKQSNITNLTDLRKLVPSISGTGNSIRAADVRIYKSQTTMNNGPEFSAL
jgi:iron complex outermembrane receptor protein